MEKHVVELGRPNRTQDGPGLSLLDALNSSRITTAYTRLEATPDDPRFPRPSARVIVVERTPSSEWKVWEFTLAGGGFQGWPMADYRDAEAYCAYNLRTPRGPIWYPAVSKVEVEHETGVLNPTF